MFVSGGSAPLLPNRSHPPAGPLPPRRRVIPADLAARVRPVSTAASRLLPLPAPRVPLFPDGALRRGGTTLVTGAPGLGASTLALALLASASAGAGWSAAVGLADPGVVAIAELGFDLRRVVFVPRPRAGWADATAELLDGVDAVLVRPPGRVRPTAARHLVARARDRQSALVVLADRPDRWPEGPDAVLSVTASTWKGIGSGYGHLQARRAEVRAAWRRPAGRETSCTVWLPSGDGVMAAPAHGDDGADRFDPA